MTKQSKKLPKPGEIAFVDDVLDPQARNPKDRFCVVVAVEQDASDPRVVLVAITSQKEQIPVDDCIPLAWRWDRHPQTGLWQPSFAACHWRIGRRLSELRHQGRYVGDKARDAILARLASS